MVDLNIIIECKEFEYTATLPISEDAAKMIDGYDLGSFVVEYIYKMIKEVEDGKED